MDYKEQFLENVESEFDAYKQQELAKPLEYIFYNSGKNKFYIALKEYFEYIDLDEEQYEILLMDGNKILHKLWVHFLDTDNFTVDTFDGTNDFVDNYVDYLQENYEDDRDRDEEM